ncbi:hypothetical protein NK718_13035, partial [Alsobacter sp. SYSU M60028]
MADLTSAGSSYSGSSGDILVFYEDGVVSGSGQYRDFLSMQNNGTETGFNSDISSDYLNVQASQTTTLKLSSLEIVEYGGVQYYAIRLDINEGQGGTNPKLTLTDFTVYQSTEPADSSDVGTYPNFSGFTEIVSITEDLNLLDHESGSGHDDYLFLIKVSAFDGQGDYVTVAATFDGASAGKEGFRALVVPTFDISGTKFLDANGDGQTTGDSGLGGVTVYVDMDGSGTLNTGDISTVTAADGTWSITGLGQLAVGKSVLEDLPDGYQQTLGQAGYTLDGTNQTGLNFANFALFDISGTKYVDADGDGVIDPGEVGL